VATSVYLSPKTILMRLSSKDMNIKKLHTALLLYYKLEAKTMVHSRRPHSNHLKQLHLNWEATVPQVEEKTLSPYGQIIANKCNSGFTSSKWAS
jgi:hypothetical protein